MECWKIVSAPRLQQANALLGLAPRMIGIVGAALGSWLITSIGAGYALAFDSITFFVAGALVLTLAKDATTVKRGTSPFADLGEGWREVRSRTWLWTLILSGGAFQFAYFPALAVLGPEIARKHLGGPPAWASIITGELVGGIIGGVIAFKIQFPRPFLLYCLAGIPMVVQIAGFASVGPLSAAIGERTTMGYAAVLLAVATLGPLIVPAVVGLRLPSIETPIPPEMETGTALA